MKKVVVIGSGFGGLATASYLAKSGFDVTVIEKNGLPGGRAMQFTEKGFSFDMGPSWYLMPEVYEKYFAFFGRKPSDYFKIIKLDSIGRAYFGNGEFIDLKGDLNGNIMLFESIEKGSGQKLKSYIQKSKATYHTAMDKLLYRDYSNLIKIMRPDILWFLIKNKIYLSLYGLVSSQFKDERLKKILLFNTLFLGVAPKKTPSFYSLLAYPIFGQGVFYPLGGIYSLVKAMETISKENGTKFIYNTEVNKILVKNGQVYGVKINGGKILKADIVISNADYHFTETTLLDKKYQSYPQKYWQSKVIAPSAFVIYLGLSKKIKNLKHHTLYLGSDWDINFKQIFEKKNWPENPSYYICVPSKTDDSVAPKGCENIFILVPVGANLQDNQKTRNQEFNKIITHIEKTIGESIVDKIIYKKILSINDYKNIYNAYQGSAFGLAHTLLQTASFRPKAKSKKVDNLYYCGQYVHPGVGMPTSIISGQIVAEEIIKNVKQI